MILAALRGFWERNICADDPFDESTIFRGIPMASATQEQDHAAEVERLMHDATQARLAFLAASRAVNTLTQQEHEILGEIMRAALEMHEAKVKMDRALKQIRELAGFLPPEPPTLRAI